MVLRLLLFLVVSLAASSVARGEPHTTEAVVVRKKAGAKARPAGKLPANTVVTIEREDGEWLRIRAKVGKKQIVGFVAKKSIAKDEPVAAKPPQDEDDSEEGFTAPTVSEPRKTTESAIVRKKPGEKQAAAGTLPAGTVVQVEGEKGRWLRVRAGTVTGYLPRTVVTGPEVATDTTAIQAPPPAPPPAEPTRKWRKPEHANEALTIEVTAASALRADPKSDAAVVAEVARGARLVVVDATVVDGFLRVRDDQERVGWIARAHVGNGSSAAAVEDAPAGDVARADTPAAGASASAARGTVRAAKRRLAIRLDAGIGYRVLGMDFTSNGSAGLANYLANADAGAADLDLDVTLHTAGRLVIGFDARLGVSRSSPGLDYPGPSGPPGEIPFSTIDVDAGVRVGVRARRMFVLAARGGAHYDAFVTSDVENAGMLPRERLLGSTLGARVDILPPGSRVSATLHVDALVLGNRRQTPGLEDGADSTARAVWAGLTARYALGPRFAIHGAYDFGRATTEWSGMSVRDPGVTSARRVDSTQLFQLGLSLEL